MKGSQNAWGTVNLKYLGGHAAGRS